ncbi:MAG: bifunctional 2-C-methyl-D-erythritol 4-phosphate cytidylyltransferase/2-C-methyl-D-erythritol 2,4-cyclodiphosphate synthase, partial [Sphingomonadaceae bacterium]|nr:bifunctional 2-C-methyl-D-erythritol 4-phosphate cytidylyltransferase/2-C-methyl-D-erythritol 2,4-cyclodiphosphate synthase [Sphingomonadaceae bacterium]
MPRPATLALIVAAGRGQRAGEGLPKQYRPVGGQAVLRRTVQAFLDHPHVDGVQVVIHPDDRDLYEAAVSGLDLPSPILGGATRQESVRRGLEAIDCDIVLIHDAARAFVSAAVIDRVIGALETDEGAVPALPVSDSLRRGASHIDGEVDREGLHRVQTPQGFRFDAIRAAHCGAIAEATDDAAVLRAAGGRVALVEGDEANMKLTTPGDFQRADAALAAAMTSRTAMGFDVHRFGPGDHLWLCGVRVPHSQGVIGHSDADVGLHALTDALLGTVGDGDIGQHFPPSDPQWKGASSDRFLAHAAGLVAARGGRIDHVDVTIISERPKVGPHRDAMRQRIADILGLGIGAVSVKATTTEALGFTG